MCTTHCAARTVPAVPPLLSLLVLSPAQLPALTLRSRWMMGGLWPCRYTRPCKICHAQRFSTVSSTTFRFFRYLPQGVQCKWRVLSAALAPLLSPGSAWRQRSIHSGLPCCLYSINSSQQLTGAVCQT